MSAKTSFFLSAFIVALLCGISVRIARHFALKHALFDIPNARSSHKLPVPRLGGAAVVPVVLLVVGCFAPRETLPLLLLIAVLGGAVVLFTVSLVDDVHSLSTGVRFAVQLVSTGVFLWIALNAAAANSFDRFVLWRFVSPSFLFPLSLSYLLLTLWMIASINIYNFMDGIDAIAGLQAAIAGMAWCFLGHIFLIPFVAFLGACMFAGAVGFLTLNWPPARIFLGDSGSTVFGYIFAALPIVATVETRARVPISTFLLIGALVVWPFLFDGSFTIFRRLKNGENVLTAHRSHLYQRLVISGLSQTVVSCLYGALALVGAGLAWGVACRKPGAMLASGLGPFLLFAMLLLWLRCREAASSCH